MGADITCRLTARLATALPLLLGMCPASLDPPTPGAGLVVALGFDDGLASQVAAAELLGRHGMRATFYVNSARVGRPGRLTWDQIDALAAAGHEIGGHTLTHPRLPELPPDEQAREVCADRRALAHRGLPVPSFAYPFGAWSPEVAAVVAGCGYLNARIVGGRCPVCPTAGPLPPADAFAIPTPGSVRDTTTLPELTGRVERAEQSGGLLVLVFHAVCDGCGTFSTRPDTLEQFLSWLQPRTSRGTVVEPLGEALGAGS